MNKRYLALLALVVVATVGFGVIAIASGDDQTANCPSGQTLSVAKVNGDTFTNDKTPPDSGYYSDSVSGSGLDYTLDSGTDRATLTVKGGKGTLTITCR